MIDRPSTIEPRQRIGMTLAFIGGLWILTGMGLVLDGFADRGRVHPVIRDGSPVGPLRVPFAGPDHPSRWWRRPVRGPLDRRDGPRDRRVSASCSVPFQQFPRSVSPFWR